MGQSGADESTGSTEESRGLKQSEEGWSWGCDGGVRLSSNDIFWLLCAVALNPLSTPLRVGYPCDKVDNVGESPILKIAPRSALLLHKIIKKRGEEYHLYFGEETFFNTATVEKLHHC